MQTECTLFIDRSVPVDFDVPEALPYSGKISNGAIFRIIRIIRKRTSCAKIRTCENFFSVHVLEIKLYYRERRIAQMALYRFFFCTGLCLVLSLLLQLKTPTQQSSSVLIVNLSTHQQRRGWRYCPFLFGTVTPRLKRNSRCLCRHDSLLSWWTMSDHP